MKEMTGKPNSQSASAIIIVLFLICSAVLVGSNDQSYRDLHIMLDTGIFLLSSILAKLFWDIGNHTGQSFSRWMSASFTVTAFWDFLHLLSSLEWSGPLTRIGVAFHPLQTAAWAPSAYLLPIGIICSIWMMEKSKHYSSIFGVLLLLLGAGILALGLVISHDSSHHWLGISYPVLVFIPLLWIAVLLASWKFRRADRILPALAIMSIILLPSQVCMLYAHTPHDGYAMVAHIGGIAGTLILLFSIMQMSSIDMLARIRAERELVLANAELEHQVSERTAQLDAATTAKLRTEQAQLQREQLLQAIADNSTAVIYAKDLEGRYLLANRRFTDLFHLTKEAVLGKSDHEIFPKEAADAFRSVDKRVAVAPGPVMEEELAPHDDGWHTYVSVKCPLWDPEGKPYGIFGISTDITERKQMEETLRSSEERTRLILETALDAVVAIDSNSMITEWNPQAEMTFGWTQQEVLGRSLVETIIPERYRKAHLDGIQRYLSTGTPTILGRRMEFMALHRDGHEFPIELSITPIRTDGSLGFSAFLRDITERKMAESKVQAQLERLKLLHHITRAIGGREDLGSIYQIMLRSLEDHLSFDFGCICNYDPIGQHLAVIHIGVGSQQVAEDLKLTEHAHIPIDGNGLSLCLKGQLVYEPDIAEVKMPFPQRLSQVGLSSLVIAPLLVESKVFGVFILARKIKNGFSSGECEFLQQLSEHVALAAHQTQLYDALQKAYDDLRQTQEAVMQQERLRALGQMASGIAHDINNAISPVALYTESLLENERNLSPQARKYLETIQRSMDDVAETVARMREFYRQREPQLVLVPVDINTLILQVIDLTRARWNDIPQQQGISIQIRKELAPNLPAVMGVESEIREALTNLIFNAVDAMPHGGSLCLRTILSETSKQTGEITTSQNIQVEVIDTGIGMDEETRIRCTEPFFTTKGERGTGLGLAMVYGVISRHRAEMEIESTPGQGTVVRLFLPVQTSSALEPSRSEAILTVPSRLRILIVDDDPLLLKSLRDTLETDGHLITVSNGGKEGIETFRAAQQNDQPFAVVITDLGMPYVDGRRVASAIKETSPTTPVILLTGWGQRLSAEGDIPPHVDQVLSKPPKLRTLREALALCLSAKQN